MALTDNQVRITPSVLDRLLDDDPRMSRDPVASQATSLRDLKAAVRRDLEWLLNTRAVVPNTAGLEETQNSVALYGIPDFTGMSVTNSAEQKRIVEVLENAVKTFEPRFKGVKVSMETPDYYDRRMKFRIEALLDVEPAPEPITFDTVLQFGGDFSVVEK